MKYMNRRGLKLFAVAALLPMMPAGAQAQPAPPRGVQAGVGHVSAKDAAVTAQLKRMVREFLAKVPEGDKKVFDNFFADDVIYTRSAGVTVSKAEILKNVDARSVTEPQATFAADEFTVHPYGDMAVINFRLIMRDVNQGKPRTVYFRNTGTFVKRNGRWQAVAWQATRVPPIRGQAMAHD